MEDVKHIIMMLNRDLETDIKIQISMITCIDCKKRYWDGDTMNIVYDYDELRLTNTNKCIRYNLFCDKCVKNVERRKYGYSACIRIEEVIRIDTMFRMVMSGRASLNLSPSYRNEPTLIKRG